MDDQQLANLYVSIDNIEYRLEKKKKKLGITDEYMNQKNT